MRRVLVVANKWWEADPLVNVLSSAASTPAPIRFVHDRSERGLRGYVEASRGRIEVWCIQDLIPSARNASSTQVKAEALPGLLTSPDVVLVIAFGTAATPADDLRNGCVVIGTKTFYHDPHAKDSNSDWPPPSPDTIIDSKLTPAAFAAMAGEPLAKQIAASMLAVPLNPAPQLSALIDYTYVALSDVNVTNYADYDWADPQVIDAYRKLGSQNLIGSLETTHAVIAACSEAPFMFVSGITDRVGHFQDEVVPATYQQNFVAAHNAGLAIAFMIPQIAVTMLAVR